MRNPKKNKTSFFIKGFTQTALLTVISRISGFARDIFIKQAMGRINLIDQGFYCLRLEKYSDQESS